MEVFLLPCFFEPLEILLAFEGAYSWGDGMCKVWSSATPLKTLLRGLHFVLSFRLIIAIFVGNKIRLSYFLPLYETSLARIIQSKRLITPEEEEERLDRHNRRLEKRVIEECRKIIYQLEELKPYRPLKDI